MKFCKCFILDAEKNSINYKTEYLIDGRKRIFYEPTVVGNVKINPNFSFEKSFISGPVEIHISKEKEPIDGSPLIVHAFDPTAVLLLDFPDQILINTTNRFVIDPTKAGKGSLKIAIRGLK
jgi:hypothetical protein